MHPMSVSPLISRVLEDEEEGRKPASSSSPDLPSSLQKAKARESQQELEIGSS